MAFSAEDMNPHELSVALVESVTVRSGDTTVAELEITNHGDRDLGLWTNRHLTAGVVDDNGNGVGGFVGAQTMVGQLFWLPSHRATRVLVLIGTTSTVRGLGDTIPPGSWAIHTTLWVGDETTDLTAPIAERGRHIHTPPLPITITDYN